MWARARRLAAHSLVGTLLYSLTAAALPPASTFLSPGIAAASGEVLTSPRYIDVAVMPNGQVGMIFQNNGAEVRFKRYTDEQSTDPSVQLSTATPGYPQIATFRGELVAGYVDTRTPNVGLFIFRISSDNGVTWGPEFYPFGAETFDSSSQWTPVVTSSRDGQTLYLFNAVGAVIPTYRSTIDPTLRAWTTAAPAGDASMRTAGGQYGGNNCGSAGAECYRAHGYSFMETAIPGRWIYIAKSDSGFGQSGRGTQYGTLGGSWSAQIDLGGSGGLSGGGESGATTFLDRSGNVYYVRATEWGDNVYFQRSTDSGASWGPRVYAYAPGLSTYATSAPVGLYVSNYSQGEYVWWAGFGGTEDTARVDGIWTQALAYPDTGTARIFGSAGGDWDAGLAWTYTFGRANPDASADTGVYTTSAEDLTLPGRLLNLSFTRTYNSADTTSGPLGPGWTHSYNWKLTENAALVQIRRGDGRRDKFSAIGGGSYSNPPNVYDTLVKNADGSFTLTLTNQVAYEFATTGVLTRIHEPAGNQITLTYTGANLTTITDSVGRQVALSYGGAGRLLQLQDPSGRKVTYAYDDAGRLTGVYDKFANRGSGPYASAVLADSPSGYWRYDETSGTVVADQRAVQNGTTFGGVTRGQTGIAGSPSSLFDGGSGYAAIPDAAPFDFGTGDFSVEAWAYRTTSGTNTWPMIVSKRPWVSINEPGWSISSTTADPTKLALHVGNKDFADAGMQTAGGVLTANTWHHMALVYTAADRLGRLYVDGALVLTTPPTDGTTGATSSAAITMGRNNGGTGDYYGGRIDEVAIYPTALSAARVLAHYQANGKPSWQYGYETTGQHITTVTDPDARVRVTNTYDAAGRLATQKDGLQKLTSFTYSPSQTVITDPRLHQSTLTFDPRARLLSQSDSVSGTTRTLQYAYDNAGNRNVVIDRDGNRTDFTYDTRGNVLTKTDPQLNPQTPRYVTTFSYDSKNNVTQILDPRGFATTNSYDAATNTLLSTTAQIDQSTSAVTRYEYADLANPGLPTKVISPRGNTGPAPNYTYSQSLSYDAQANLVTRIDADGAKTTYGYDSVGRRTSMVDPDGYGPGGVPSAHTWVTAYDENDRVTSQTDPLSHSTTNGYNGSGDRTARTDRNGNVTSYSYDSAGRLATVAQKPAPVGQPTLVYTTTLTRDGNGNVTKVTQANNVVTDYTFDELDRLTSVVTHPTTTTSLTTSYVLNGNGQPTTKTTGDGVAITYGYDTMARLTSVAATGLTAITYGYDALSHRVAMTDGTGTTTYAYDGLGRLTQAVQPNGTTTYGYDLDSNRTTLGYPTVGTVGYAYSPGGRLNTVTDWAAHSATYQYTPAGLASSVTVPGGMTTTYSYDTAHRLTQLVNAVGANTVSSHAYTLDSEGNRTALDEVVSGITLPGATDHVGYSYDGLERLTAGTTTNPERFSLDAASNIASRTGPTATYSYDTANRLTSDGTQAFTWNTADRLTNRGSDTFGYDPLDRMTSSTVSATARTYTYNGDGLLQSRTQGSATTFLWDPSSSPSRLLQQGSDKIVYGLGPLWVVRADGSTTSFARDGGKSVRAELNGSGTVTASFRYQAYGAIVQSSGAATPSYLGYAGQLQDPSGLLYMRARWYDPSVGRFTTRDPLPSDPVQPISVNAYLYGNANPAIKFDPTGLIASADDSGGCEDLSGCAPVTQPGNWAYAIADVFRDLDADDPVRKGSAYAIVVAAPVAVGGLAIAAGPAIAGGATSVAGGVATRGQAALAASQEFLGTEGPVFGRGGGVLNSNDFLRIGWGWKQSVDMEVFRVSIGGPKAPFWFHIDLFHE